MQLQLVIIMFSVYLASFLTCYILKLIWLVPLWQVINQDLNFIHKCLIRKIELPVVGGRLVKG
jgi:hypothetical protein